MADQSDFVRFTAALFLPRKCISSSDDFLNDLLPGLKEDDVHLGIFYTPLDKGIVYSVDEFVGDLTAALGEYE